MINECVNASICQKVWNFEQQMINVNKNEQQLSSFEYLFLTISIWREALPVSTYKTVKVTLIVQIKGYQ